MTKPGTPVGRMPAKLSFNARQIVTAGFADEVENMNQVGYALDVAHFSSGTAEALPSPPYQSGAW